MEGLSSSPCFLALRGTPYLPNTCVQWNRSKGPFSGKSATLVLTACLSSPRLTVTSIETLFHRNFWSIISICGICLLISWSPTVISPPILFNNKDFTNKSVVAICEQCISFGKYNRVTTRNLAAGFFRHVSGPWEGFPAQATANIIKMPWYNQRGPMKCWWLTSGNAQPSSRACILWVIECGLRAGEKNTQRNLHTLRYWLRSESKRNAQFYRKSGVSIISSTFISD